MKKKNYNLHDVLMCDLTIWHAGTRGEITSVSTACHQIEVFSRVLRTSISSFLESGEETVEKNLAEFTVFTRSHMLNNFGWNFVVLSFTVIHIIGMYWYVDFGQPAWCVWEVRRACCGAENGLSRRAHVPVQSTADARLVPRAARRVKHSTTLPGDPQVR